jgi:hypothetical protein
MKSIFNSVKLIVQGFFKDYKLFVGITFYYFSIKSLVRIFETLESLNSLAFLI